MTYIDKQFVYHAVPFTGLLVERAIIIVCNDLERVVESLKQSNPLKVFK